MMSKIASQTVELSFDSVLECQYDIYFYSILSTGTLYLVRFNIRSNKYLKLMLVISEKHYE